MAEHYGCAVLPARPRKPRDKAKVETGVLIAKRWIPAVLRHRSFHNLAQLNAAIRECLERLNNHPNFIEIRRGQREPNSGLIHHSDRGIQYACNEYRSLLHDYGMVSSILPIAWTMWWRDVLQ